jgi:hypothetical protein
VAEDIDGDRGHLQGAPSEIVQSELAQIPKGDSGSALNQYRAIYAMTRQKGLGSAPGGVEPTIEFAHLTALAAARSIDPGFDSPAPRSD